MQYITFTQLRTEAKILAIALEKGEEVKLIRKSKVVGKVVPDNEANEKIINAKKLEAKIYRLNLPSFTMKEIDRRYMAAMIKKHGQGIS